MPLMLRETLVLRSPVGAAVAADVAAVVADAAAAGVAEPRTVTVPIVTAMARAPVMRAREVLMGTPIEGVIAGVVPPEGARKRQDPSM